MENESENLIENEEQADELLSQIEAPDGGPIGDESREAQVAQPEEFTLTVGGKEIKAKREQLMQWAQQGYSAPGKISQLSRELEGWKSKWSEHEPKWKQLQEKYGPVDEYVQKNPQFWDHVLSSFEQRNQALSDQGNPLAQTVTSLQQQVQDLIQHKNQVEEERTKQRTMQEDQAYMHSFEGMKKTYPDIDFDSPDESGKSLEYKVLEYATQNGIRNFKTAFRDFYHDELQKRAAEQARENFTKGKQKNTKLGILGITPMPTKRISSDVRGKSYDDLAKEALQELGIG